MRVSYRFPNIPVLKDIEVLVSSRGDIIDCEISGPNCERVVGPIKAYFGSFNKIRPLADHEEANWYSLYWQRVPGEAHAHFVEGFWRTWFFRQPTPNVITLAITENCQCRCVHCSADIGSSSTPCDFMPLTVRNVLQNPVHALWEKLIQHPAYRQHCRKCRMQTTSFREKYIDTIPDGAELPYPMDFTGLRENCSC